MKKFFAPNLDTRGRLVRGVGGIACVGAGVVLGGDQRILAVVLILSGGFMLLEAVRGWCVMRACGIRTKL
jgi:hypothetical protein